MQASPDPPLAPEIAEFLGGSISRPLSVGQINSLINQTLDEALPPAFFVQGEISNFRTYDRGHAFFTLKDNAAELPCVLWKDALARLKFRPKDGLAVIARGAVRLYEPQGKLQLYVETLLPQGAGALELAFRQLCEKLRGEGLFAQERKRPLPRLPEHIAIITSRTGDVLHDVLTTAWRRFPGLSVSLFPVRVQGAQAAPDIIRAIELINAYSQSHPESQKSKIALILLVRGGGSLEDLAAFNDETLARAICASAIPIATGIGHEPDTTIADLVGDLRGPTPTGIAELTIPDVRAIWSELAAKGAILTRDLRRMHTAAENRLALAASRLAHAGAAALRERRGKVDVLARQVERIEPRHAIAQGWRRLEESERRLGAAARLRLSRQADAVKRLAHRLELLSPRADLIRRRDRLDHAAARLTAALQNRLRTSHDRLAATADQLRIVSPTAILDRGFSITTDKEGNILRSAEQVKKGDPITTRLAEGTIHSTVGKARQGLLF